MEGYAFFLSEPAGSVDDGMDVYEELLPELREVGGNWLIRAPFGPLLQERRKVSQ